MKKSKKTAKQPKLNDALIAAIKASDAASVVSLLEQGADPNCSSEVTLYSFSTQQMSALDLAMSWCCRMDPSGPVGYTDDEFNETLVRALIAGGARLHKISEFDEPPLSRAVNLGEMIPNRYEFISFMLDRGANVNELHNHIFTALHAACGPMGDYILVNLLLDRGANINPHTGYDSPLMCAAASKLKGIVELLLARGADVHYQTKAGETAFSKAKGKRGVGKEIREMLEAAGARPNV